MTHNGGVDPLGVFNLFLKMVANIIVSKLGINFRGLIRRGSFPMCWPSDYVAAIPKGAPFPDRRTTVTVLFWRVVCLGSFLACWRQANVTHIPKGPPSSSVVNYRMISITSVLSKAFEHVVSVRL